jgi:hypothetical protein
MVAKRIEERRTKLEKQTQASLLRLHLHHSYMCLGLGRFPLKKYRYS